MSPRELWAKVISRTLNDPYSKMAHSFFVLFPKKSKAQYEVDYKRKIIGGPRIKSVRGKNVDDLNIPTFLS